jgi:hypothetical protein
MTTNSASYDGQAGVLKIGSNAVAEVRSFTIDQETATVEKTKMGDTSRSYLPSLAQFSGTMSVFHRDDDTAHNAIFAAAQGGDPVTIELFPSGETTGIKLNGTVLITGDSISSNFDSMVEREISFQGSGGLTKTDL